MSTSRNTVQRNLVLQAVHSLHNHPTADHIYQYVAAQHPSISKGTVYRNLGNLVNQGEIKRVSHLDAADRFDFQTHPHYHFHCVQCDGVFDVDLANQNHLLDKLENPKGFEFHSLEITCTGLCRQCKEK